MIIVRAPLRIPVGGGGTDLPSYYSQFCGEWVSAAIDKYVYVVINKIAQPGFKIRYSKTEEVARPDQIQHPIIREAIKLLKISDGIEIVSMADVSTNTGLGSSSSFTIALLTALHAFLRNTPQDNIPPRQELAEQACHIAMDLLKEPSGKQDEYASACGGLNSFYISQNGGVRIEPLYPQKISPGQLRELENNLLMFYTGLRRDSRDVLAIQAKATHDGEKEMVENLHRVKGIGREIKSVLINGEFHRFGELLDLHWQEKTKRMGTSNAQINQWYEIAKQNGAVGGKLMGAGGGGFFLFYCEDQKDKHKLRQAMAGQGLEEQLFHFDLDGVKIIADFK